MTTLNTLATGCGLSLAETKNILTEVGAQVEGSNEPISADDMNKLFAFVAKAGINQALMLGGEKCESRVRSKCSSLWKHCPETRDDFNNDYDICESYYIGLARGSVGLRLRGANRIH